MQNVADVQEIPASAAGAGRDAGSADAGGTAALTGTAPATGAALADPAKPAMPTTGPATTIAAARNDLRIVAFRDFKSGPPFERVSLPR
jgi:hypothetical protein